MSPDEKLNKIIEKSALKQSNNAEQKSQLNPEVLSSLQSEAEEIKKYESSELEAAALGAARGLTFGLSDQALVKAGRITGYTPQELDNIKKYNETSSLLGEAAGIIGPSLLSGGTTALAGAARATTTGVRAAEAAGKITERALAKVLTEQGKNSIASKIVAKSIPKLLGSGVEGAVYGAGQLISEDALGNAELNAENLIASVGTGALLGATSRGIFEAPKLLAPVAKKAGNKIPKKAYEFFDRPEAALELIGTTPKKAQKLTKFRPDFVEELPDWLASKANLKYFTKTKNLEQSIKQLKDDAANTLSSLSNTADNIIKANPTTAPLAANKYIKITNAIAQVKDNKLIKEIGLSKLNNIEKSTIRLAEKSAKLSKPASVLEFRKLKREIDDIIPYGTENSKLEVTELKKLRGTVDDIVQDLVTFADNIQPSGLLEKYKQANKDYSYASIIEPNLESKLAKEAASQFPGFRDTILTSATAAGFGGPIAAAALGAKKLAESDLRRRAIILSGVEKANVTINKKISSGINKIFSTAKQKSAAASSTLIESAYSLDPEKKSKPKNKTEAFQNTVKNITELKADPGKLEKIVARRTMHLQPIAPNTTNFAIQQALKGLEFLYQKMPLQASANDSAQAFTKRKYEPSSIEIAKFERYMEAVENPMSVIDRLEQGTLTREAAEALQVVYPQIFGKMQESLIDKLEKTKEPIPYTKRLQMGILLDVETDSSLKSENIAQLQSNLVSMDLQPSGGPTAARADKLNIADRRETKQNQIAQK